jgi:NAD(P)-dependent dehydrogenase (short-subunit alcohol dehydrogenase family)
MSDLDGKVIVITGATQGLGAAFARRCVALGAQVAVCGRNRERGEAIAEELDGLFLEVELSDPASCQAVMPAVQAHFGRLDGLVNSAGLSTRGTLDDTTVELWDHLFAVNVRAPFLLIQGAARVMRAGGSVVNIITMSSHGGQPELMAYSASKGALVTLTRNLANALQERRIRVNGLNIGWTATDGEHVVQGGGDWLAEADASRPFGRLLRPDDIAPMVTHLLSDAAEMITGSVMDFDQIVRV